MPNLCYNQLSERMHEHAGHQNWMLDITDFVSHATLEWNSIWPFRRVIKKIQVKLLSFGKKLKSETVNDACSCKLSS